MKKRAFALVAVVAALALVAPGVWAQEEPGKPNPVPGIGVVHRIIKLLHQIDRKVDHLTVLTGRLVRQQFVPIIMPAPDLEAADVDEDGTIEVPARLVATRIDADNLLPRREPIPITLTGVVAGPEGSETTVEVRAVLIVDPRPHRPNPDQPPTEDAE